MNNENRISKAEYERRFGEAHRARFKKWPWNKFTSKWADEQAKPPERKPQF